MAKFSESLTQQHSDFIEQQHMFFTATAPDSGRINLSPKGMDTFRVINQHTVAYLDLTGSGNETAAHILQNRRMTIMMCAFAGEPLIFRIYGKGDVVLPDTPEWTSLAPLFPAIVGTRQIIKCLIESTQTSCGFSVPLYEFQGQRSKLVEWSEKKGSDGLQQYRIEKNTTSIDGITIPLNYKN
jgi:hypothetical protein